MNPSIDKAKKLMERRQEAKRRQKLFHILELIIDGKIDSSKVNIGKIYNQKGPRQTYVSPKDRASYNYGYMEVDEMLAGTPFYGES